MIKNIKLSAIVISVGILMAGCSTMKGALPSGADQVSQRFFDALQKSDTQEVHSLFSQQLSEKITQEKFDQFIEIVESHWGRIESEETAVLPFHQRTGEDAFLPSDTSTVKRYTYEVKFQNATINCDITVAQETDGYKIIWLSFWGSGNYVTADINEKAGDLFSKQ